MDVAYRVDPGPAVNLGPITVQGLDRMNESFVRRRLLIQQGEQFDPAKIEAARQDLASLGVFATVRARAADSLNPQGQIPIAIDVTERARHVVAFNAGFSTDLGGSAGVTWQHRNLFGNAEQLNLGASATGLGGSAVVRPGYNVTAALVKPDIFTRDQSMTISLQGIKESLEAYDRKAVLGGVQFTRKLDERWTATAGLLAQQSRITQEGATNDYTLLGLPLGVKYDSTGTLFEPISGIKAALNVTPTASLNGGANFTILQASASTYVNLAQPGRSVIALRGTVASIQGATTFQVPARPAPLRRRQRHHPRLQIPVRRPHLPQPTPDRRNLPRRRNRRIPPALRRIPRRRHLRRRRPGRHQQQPLQRQRPDRGRHRRPLLHPHRPHPPRRRPPPHQTTRQRLLRNLHRPRPSLLILPPLPLQRERAGVRALRATNTNANHRASMKKVLLLALATLLLLPVLATAAILIALNTAPGQALAERQIAALTSNTIIPKGLSGRFPDQLRLASLELHDPKGPYFTIENIELDWSPLALLHKQARINRLQAASLTLARLPIPEPTPPTPSDPAKPFTLPVRITIDSLHIAKAQLAIIGAPATIALDAKADLPTLESGTATLSAKRLDSPGAYTLNAEITPQSINATLNVAEPEQGLIATLATLPNIGPLKIDAAIDGPKTALAATLNLTAGPLTATAKGAINLEANTAAIDLAANAPAMQPAPGVSWTAIDLNAHIAGPFTKPDATGTLRIDALQAAGASIQSLTAAIAGNAGQVTLDATASTLKIPGPNPDLLASSPIRLQAAAQLDDPARPIKFTLTHPILAAQGVARTAANPALDATITLPDLAPLAALANTALAGRTTIDLHATQTNGATTLESTATLALTAGPGPSATLIGPNAKLALAATFDGATLTLSRLTLDAAALSLALSGASKPDGIDFTAKLATPNLTLLAPTINGEATLEARIQGPLEALKLDATIAGAVGAPNIPKAPIQLTAALTGLPTRPTGQITATGTFANAPIQLALDATRDPDGTLHATINQAGWRSLHLEGALTLPQGATLPQGRIALNFQKLEDLRPLLNQPIAGALAATILLDPNAITLEAEARNTGLPGNQLGHATVKAKITNPLDNPTVAATITAESIAAGTATGNARIEANGTQDALAIRTTANLTLAGTPTQIAANALFNATAQTLRLDTIQATAPYNNQPETLRLLAPATIRLAPAITVDRLRLGLRQATLDIAGRLSPTLDTTIALRTPADIAALIDPTLAMDGAITVDAKLTGTPAQPGGSIRLAATSLRLRTGPGRAIPAANLTASAQLAGTSARVDARLTAGTAQLALNGQAPLGAGPLNLRANGGLDLTLLDPILSPAGRRARGRLTIDATITGAAAAPRIAGSAQLANGEIQDYAQGLRISDIAATIRADGDTIRIASLTGRAGPGTIAASGTIGLPPTLPLDLTLTLRNARPLASDQISADLDADITLKGPAASGLQLAGTMRIRRAELRIPSTLPASVAVLNVRRPGDKPPPPPAPPRRPHRPQPQHRRPRRHLRPRPRHRRRTRRRPDHQGNQRNPPGRRRPQPPPRRHQRRRHNPQLRPRQSRLRRNRRQPRHRPNPRLRRRQHRRRRHRNSRHHRLRQQTRHPPQQHPRPPARRSPRLPHLQTQRQRTRPLPNRPDRRQPRRTHRGHQRRRLQPPRIRPQRPRSRPPLPRRRVRQQQNPHHRSRPLRRRRRLRRRQTRNHRQPVPGHRPDRHHQRPQTPGRRRLRPRRQPGRPHLPVRILIRAEPYASSAKPDRTTSRSRAICTTRKMRGGDASAS